MKKVVVAIHYFPERSPEVAVRALTRMIESCKPLLRDFEACGQPYKRKRELTMHQVKLIEKHFGGPEIPF